MDAKARAECRSAALAALRAADTDKMPLATTDKRLVEYFDGIKERPDEHNLYEILSARRFLSFFGRYKWDGEQVRQFVQFYERLEFSGLDGRRQYQLTPVQVFMFASLLGWYTENGRRLTRNAIWFVPRKFGKTTSAASLAVYELFVGDANAQAYIGANSYNQAQICFKEVSQIVKQLDPTRMLFRATREHIGWRNGNPYNKESTIDCLSGDATTKDGLSASLVIMDEYAQARYVRDHSVGAELFEVLRSSEGIRRNPLNIILTTASRVPDSPFAFELAHAQQTLLGEDEDDRLSTMLFQPDDGDAYDDPRTWKKCNPHIGVTVQPDYYATEWAAAQSNAERMVEFKTKLLNVFTADSLQEWIPTRRVSELTVDEYPFEGGEPTMAAFDLSISDDFSVVTYTSYSHTTHRFFVESHYFLPSKLLSTHPNKLLYREWADRGYLNICEGDVIDYKAIIDDIFEMNRRRRILRIGYDSYKAHEVVNALAGAMSAKEAARVLVPVRQTWAAFTSATQTLELWIKREPGGVLFDDNPIQRYCFGNAYLSTDRMGNQKPEKRKPNLKIDSVITTVMTFKLFDETKL